MEESNQSSTTAPLNWQPTESTSNGQYSGTASLTSSTADSQVEGEETNEGNRERHPHHLQQRTNVSYNSQSMATGDDDQAMRVNNGWIRDDTWSCVAIVFTFWFFASMTMIIGVYGSVTLILGPHSSILIKPNSYFVDSVKIEELYEVAEGPILLYGFNEDPPLDVVLTWSDTHNVTLQSSTHKDWIYFLNEGSRINMSYTVNSTSSSSLIFVIAQGYAGLNQWLEDPSLPNTTLSWQVIQGNGMIQQDIFTSSSYYVALGNLNGEAAEVQLNMRLRTLVYNTTEAYDKCSFTQGECSVKLSFGGGNAVLLTSPGPRPGRAVNEWYVKLSYGPRWITYVAGIGGINVLVFGAIHFLSYCACRDGNESRLHFGGEVRSETTLLLPNKDDDLSSWGSSYDSVSQDDEDPEDPQVAAVPGLLLEGKSAKDGENNTRRLCAICYDAPRDSFFLPCGHCVACFTCGTRIAEASGTCPICRRPMKKVRKIFTV